MLRRDSTRITREPVAAPQPDLAFTTKELLDNLEADLAALDAKLMMVQLEGLTREQKAQWAREITKVSEAITAVRNARLAAISAAFESALPELQGATDSLKRDLSRLQDSVAIINAIGSALGIVERIVSLLG
jgi:hypothetical protein